MGILFVNLLTFLAVFLAVFAVNAIALDLTKDERQRLDQELEERYRLRSRERARNAPLPMDFSQIAAEAAAEQQRSPGFVERVEIFIEQSGVEMSPSSLYIFAAVSAAVAGLLIGVGFNAPLMAGPAALAGAAAPWLYVARKRSKRLALLREQLPDAFDMMARVIRAGQTVSQAMQAIGDEFARPVSLEMLYCSEQMNLGLSPEAALRDLARRTGLLELKIFSLAVLVHHQTGGNLAELLDKLAHMVRQRFRIHGMIQSLTAQGRLQAAILLCLPPAMFGLLMLVHPKYESLLLDYPMLIAIALGLMFMGWLWIRKIINFDY